MKFFLTLALMAALGAAVFSCRHQSLMDTGSQNTTTGSGGTSTSTLVSCSSDTAYFQQQVLPVFISNCAVSGCHDATTRQSGVNLTNYQSILTTGDVRPFRPDNSEVWKKIAAADPSKRMPPLPRNALTQAQKDIIYKWIMQGAKNNSCQATSCDTANVAYSGAIKTIISNQCLGCHSGNTPQGNINYSTYTGIKAKVTDGRLWGTINHLPGYSPMPKGAAKLTDCEIVQFKKWIESGAPNN